MEPGPVIEIDAVVPVLPPVRGEFDPYPSGIDFSRGVVTVTISDVGESFTGMARCGTLAPRSFTRADLEAIAASLQEMYKGIVCQIIDLTGGLSEEVLGGYDHSSACVLVVRGFSQRVLGSDAEMDRCRQELAACRVDRHMLRYKKVMNKLARLNTMYGPNYQAPDYPNGKGVIVPWPERLTTLRTTLEGIPAIHALVPASGSFNGEGNYYTDVEKCYIGLHGDRERKVVIGLRFGQPFPLYFQARLKGENVGDPVGIGMEEGAMYILAKDAVGHNCRKRNELTWEHCAGLPGVGSIPRDYGSVKLLW